MKKIMNRKRYSCMLLTCLYSLPVRLNLLRSNMMELSCEQAIATFFSICLRDVLDQLRVNNFLIECNNYTTNIHGKL